MTTAELFKKREEEKNNPQLQTAPPVNEQAIKPSEGLNMAEARMAGNVIPQPEQTATATNPNPSSNVSLYEIGKQAGNINQAENTLAGKSPITTPEYEKFRNEVIAARDFDVETPEQAAARERRDYIKQGLTGLTEGLTSLANLYYTTKWAPNQKITSQMPELQKQLYRERLERDKKLENFRAWQRAKADKEEERAYNLNLFNIKQEAANKAAEKKAKLDAQAAQIKYLRDLGLIDARKEADLEKQKGKAALDKELESIRQKNRISLKAMPSYGDNKVKTSAMSSDGDMMTRSSPLTKEEAMQIVYMSPDYTDKLEDYRKTTTTTDEYGNPKTSVGEIDWFAAASDILANGSVSSDVLEQMGYSRSKTAPNKKKTLPGVSGNNKNNKHLNL